MTVLERMGRDPAWSRLHPGKGSRWPGLSAGVPDERAPGVYDLDRGRFEEVSPADDPRLPALASWSRRGEIVAYRPEHRAVVRIARPEGSVFVKLTSPRKARRLIEAHRALGLATPGPALPRIEQADDAEGVVVFRELEGRPLHERLGSDGAILEDAIRVGRALAGFQSAKLAPRALRDADPEDLATWCDRAAGAFPALSERIRSTQRLVDAGRDPETQSSGLVPTHGDLHDKNVLIGVEVGFLDVGGCVRAEPARDPGNLMAHLVLRGLQGIAPAAGARAWAEAFVRGYHESGGRATTGELDGARAAALLRLACVYLFRRDWRGVPAKLLDEAAALARGGSPDSSPSS